MNPLITFILTDTTTGDSYDFTEVLLALSPLTRKAEEEGRAPLVLFFDTISVELPLMHTAALFDFDLLAAYPRYTVDMRLSGNIIFRGVVDVVSVVRTGAETVKFDVVSILAQLDRVRFASPWQPYDLVQAWHEQFTAGTIAQVQFVPQQRVGTTDFYQKLYITPLPTWPGSTFPFRTGDYLIHPEFNQLVYQIVNAKIIQTAPSIYFYELTLDRTYFAPNYTPGTSGPIYSAVSMIAREFYGQDIYEFAFNPDGDALFTFQVEDLSPNSLASVFFSQLGGWPVASTFMQTLLPRSVSTIISHLDDPVAILLRLLGYAGETMYVNRQGEVASTSFSEITSQPPGAFPKLKSGLQLNRELLFSWDKRVDVVQVKAVWGGETTEVELEATESLSPGASRNTRQVEIIGDQARAEELALELLQLYGVRRLQADIEYPLLGELDTAGTGINELTALELDLYSQVDPDLPGFVGSGWISELSIDLSTLTARFTINSLTPFLPEGGSANTELIP